MHPMTARAWLRSLSDALPMNRTSSIARLSLQAVASAGTPGCLKGGAFTAAVETRFVGGVLLLCSLVPFVLLVGCSRQPAGIFQGYIEGEYVYAAAPVAGTLQELGVTRGDLVQTGQLLFRLDPEPEQSALAEADQRVVQAEARLADLTKGQRPSEIAALEARLARARADAEFARSELDRFTQLRDDRVISPDEMDRARARQDAAVATVASLEADLETARLGARADEVDAARSEVDAQRAARSKAQWAFDQKEQFAPTNSAVDDTLYRVGEWVAAGRPVVSLLPPKNIKVRFFVPEPELSSIHAGDTVSVSFDGALQPAVATVRYVSTQAEFTPPVIYSRENRAKLVYMVEAHFTPDVAAELRPGQPVDIRLTR